MKKHRFLMALTLGMACLPALVSAGEPDNTTWLKMGAQYEVNERWEVSGGLEWRTKQDVGMTDRLGLDVAAKYEVLPFLKLGAGYEVHYRNRGGEGWKFRHRYHADGTLSGKWMRLKLSLRERFQHTWNTEEKEFRLRSRLKLAYDIRRCKLEPYASVEMYNGLGRGERFDVARMRYRAGLTLPLFSERWEADVFYCRQWERDGRKNIFGVDCVYKF